MWEISLSGQISAFLYSLVLGASLCFFYDIIRATRKSGADSFPAVFIGDILFWIISAAVVFIFFVSVTNGEIRGYVLFSCAVGFLLYRFTVGRLIYIPLCLLFSFIFGITRKASLLISKFCGAADKFISSVLKKIGKAIGGYTLAIKKLLKSMCGMLYTDKNKKKTENDLNE